MLQFKFNEFVLWFIYLCFFASSIYEPETGKYLLVMVLIVNIFLMYKHRMNQVILIMLIFTSTYWMYMLFYYFEDIIYSSYMNLQTLENTNGTLRVTSFFMFLFFQNIKLSDQINIRDKMINHKNSLIFFISTAVMLTIMFYSYSGENIFNAVYGDTTTNSTIFEYYFIFALAAQIYSGTNVRKKILFVINILYVFSILLLGLRLVVLQLLLMIFIFYFENKFKTRWVFLSSIGAFIMMSALSVMRSREINSFNEIFGVRNGTLYTNQGDVFLTSTVHYGLIQNGYLDLTTRLNSLFAFFQNIFLTSENQLTIGILNKYIYPDYLVGGGGFGAMYAYVWLGYFGVIGLVYYITYFINNINSGNNFTIYGVFLLITFFRWYSYSLPVVFKMGFYLFIAFGMLKIINLIVKKKEINAINN